MKTDMKVTLLDCTRNPEKLIAMGARTCYSDKPLSVMVDELSDEYSKEMVKKIMDVKHDSVLEHVTLTFAVEGVSRVLSHQLVRHRLATYHQRSQRYVKEADTDVVVPPSIQRNPEALAIYESVMGTINTAYKKLMSLEIPKEDARYVLPTAEETQLIMTMNARSFIHMLNLRCCKRAQWEIHMMADFMLVEARKVLPDIFGEVGPSCFNSSCPEGKMTCGAQCAVHRKYSEYMHSKENVNDFWHIEEDPGDKDE